MCNNSHWYVPEICSIEKDKAKEYIMKNSSEFKGDWKELKGKLKQQYTDIDLLFAEGKKDELLGRLQNKLGKSKEEIQKIIAAL